MKEIIEKRDLVLREYQIPAAEFATNNSLAVLGMAPNGGKTEISIDVISKFLRLNPTAKVLILTHSIVIATHPLIAVAIAARTVFNLNNRRCGKYFPQRLHKKKVKWI